MKIVVFGAGPIGLITSLSLTIWGHDVLCVDLNEQLIERLAKAESDLFEADLKTQLQKYLMLKKLQFGLSTDFDAEFSNIYFVAVGTPTKSDGTSDLTALQSCIKSIVQIPTAHKKTVVIKSTVPVQTNQNLSDMYKKYNVCFISNPEFLREGQALNDALNPDRIVLGHQDEPAIQLLLQIYQPLINNKENKTKVFVTDPATAEISKYASNVFLAAKISLINEISKITAKFDGDIQHVSKIVGADTRIGPEFLNSGLGYGGSCFQKDISAFVNVAAAHDIQLPMISAIETVNQQQLNRFSNLILKNIPENKICIWGISFKPETNDLREASALKIINALLKKNFTLHIHDPELSPEFLQKYAGYLNQKQIMIFKDKYQALNNCSGLAICTEWPEYVNVDLQKIKTHLSHSFIFDGRNTLDNKTATEQGLHYFSLGTHL